MFFLIFRYHLAPISQNNIIYHCHITIVALFAALPAVLSPHPCSQHRNSHNFSLRGNHASSFIPIEPYWQVLSFDVQSTTCIPGGPEQDQFFILLPANRFSLTSPHDDLVQGSCLHHQNRIEIPHLMVYRSPPNSQGNLTCGVEIRQCTFSDFRRIVRRAASKWARSAIPRGVSHRPPRPASKVPSPSVVLASTRPPTRW